MRAVLDTNVLLSGLRSRGGASFLLLQQIRQRKLVPVVSVPLFLEYEGVLTRSGAVPELTVPQIITFLDAFAQFAEPREIHFLWRPVLADTADEMLVELAIAAGPDVPVITHNIRDFAPAVRRLGLRVLTPADAARMFFQP